MKRVYRLSIVGWLILALGLAGCMTPTPTTVGEPTAATSNTETTGAIEATATAKPTDPPAATATATTAPDGADEGEGDGAAPEKLVGFTPAGDPYQGDPDAPVVIEEFSSYQCPYCARYIEEAYPLLIENYVETGKVLYIYRDYPLSGQRQSTLAAEAANCAGETGGAEAYWAMHDLLFTNQQAWSGQRG